KVLAFLFMPLVWLMNRESVRRGLPSRTGRGGGLAMVGAGGGGGGGSDGGGVGGGRDLRRSPPRRPRETGCDADSRGPRHDGSGAHAPADGAAGSAGRPGR